MSRFINSVSLGAYDFREQKDCTVRALSNAKNIAYHNAHAILSKYGRKPKKGCTAAVWHRAYTDAGMVCLGVYGTTMSARYTARIVGMQANKGITLGRLVASLPMGKYIVIITGHALAVVDGKIIDFGDNRSNKSVIAVYKDATIS